MEAPKHGTGKRSVWLKAHLAVDPATNLIVVAGISSLKHGGDGQIGEKMIRKLPKSVKRVFGDGGYDGYRFRKAVSRLGAKAIIPPPKNACLNEKSSTATTLARNKAIRQIKRLGKEGLKKWKQKTGYHKRSLAQTAIFRLKQLTGGHLCFRKQGSQASELAAKCLALNKMTALGLPKRSINNKMAA